VNVERAVPVAENGAATSSQAGSALGRVAEHVQAALGVAAVGLFLLDQDGAVVLAAHCGMSDELVNALSHRPPGEGLVGRVAASGEARVFDHVQAADAAVMGGFAASVWLPLRSGGRTIGVLGAAVRSNAEGAGDRALTGALQTRVEAVAAVTALAVEDLLAPRESANEMRALNGQSTFKGGIHKPPMGAESGAHERPMGATPGRRLASIGEMVGSLAHELNNPLTAIAGYVDLLQSGNAPDAHRALDVIAAEVQRCQRIVEGLSGFARVGSGARQTAQVNDLLGRAIDLAERRLRLDRVEVACELADDLPPVHGDPHALVQVFVNLLENARQALAGAKPPRVVILVTSRSERAVRVSVSDNGPAIAPEHLAHLFEPFFAAGNRGEGAGLGLSLSARIVREHGGRITAESTPGQGVTLTVELPLPA
jgi:signal transduction histidine kinase